MHVAAGAKAAVGPAGVLDCHLLRSGLLHSDLGDAAPGCFTGKGRQPGTQQACSDSAMALLCTALH